MQGFSTMYTCESGVELIKEGIGCYASFEKQEEDGVVNKIKVPIACIGRNVNGEDYFIEYDSRIKIG